MKTLKLRRLSYFIFAFIFLCFTCSENKKVPCKEPVSSDSLYLNRSLHQIQSRLEKGTAAYVLENAGESLAARAWICDQAEKTLDIQYFIFSTDNVGLIACDYLVRAADRGVKIRLLIDDIIVNARPDELKTLDVHPNIEIRIYNPSLNIGKNFSEKIKKIVTDLKSVQQRMHQKTIIVDSKAVIMGGRNVADQYYGYHEEYNFIDRDMLLMGEVMDTVNHFFNEFWNTSLSVPVSELVRIRYSEKQVRKKYAKLRRYACDPDHFWPQVREQISQVPDAIEKILAEGKLYFLDSVQYVADYPGKRGRVPGKKMMNATAASLIQLIRNARHTVDIQSPYLIDSDLGIELFSEAVQRGVKVRILTNSLASTDNTYTFSAYQRDREKFLKTGIRIYEFKPDAAVRMKNLSIPLQSKMKEVPKFGMHSKSMIVDGHITVVGTFNLDPRSAYFNCECQAIMYSKKLAAAMQEQFDELFKPENAWETTLQWNPDQEASRYTRAKVLTRRVVPKGIL